MAQQPNPCPFCGATLIHRIFKVLPDGQHYEHPPGDCPLADSNGLGDPMRVWADQQSIAAWNQRVAAPQPAQPAKPEQEPVAWMYPDFHGQTLLTLHRQDGLTTEIPLYTAPQPAQPAKPLTDGKWYMVRYDGLGKTFVAPALYRDSAKVFYSVEFSGIPAREVKVIYECQPAQQEPVAWRDHVEQRLMTWRQSFVNRSGDQLALDDFMDKRSLDDLIDFVCDEYAEPQRSITPGVNADREADAQVAAHAKRLALELECLLLSCEDKAATSRWWDTAHEALAHYRADLDRLYPPEHPKFMGECGGMANPVMECDCGHRWEQKS